MDFGQGQVMELPGSFSTKLPSKRHEKIRVIFFTFCLTKLGESKNTGKHEEILEEKCGKYLENSKLPCKKCDMDSHGNFVSFHVANPREFGPN